MRIIRTSTPTESWRPARSTGVALRSESPADWRHHAAAPAGNARATLKLTLLSRPPTSTIYFRTVTRASLTGFLPNEVAAPDTGDPVIPPSCAGIKGPGRRMPLAELIENGRSQEHHIAPRD